MVRRGSATDIRSGVAALARRYGLAAIAERQLATLAGLIASSPLAPTTVRDPGAILNDHLADSLVALELPAVREASTIADLGSGAGFPGLPLAIARPQADVVLLESSARKCAFIEVAIRQVETRNARPVHARAEAWPEGLEAFDLVTARAVGPLPIVAEYAAPLLRVGGSLLAWRGQQDAAEEEMAVLAADDLGLAPLEAKRVSPYDGARHRYLHLMLKVRETPERFPRRPGIARKRPLGGRRRSPPRQSGV